MNKNEAINNLKCINQCVNIFDIVSFKEEQASQVLAWLLNPFEAHNLKTKTLKALLENLCDNNKRINCFMGENKKYFFLSDITGIKNLSDKMIIQTEYSTTKGRPDILVIIEEKTKECDGYLIVIENKYGSKENNDQTKKYFSDFKKYEKYKTIYVYIDKNMDINENKIFPLKDIADNKHWYGCNYDWIIDFLDVNRPKKSSCISKILKDIYIEFSKDYETGEVYFKKFYKNIPGLLKALKKDLSKFNEIKNKKKYEPGKKGYIDNIKFYQFAGAYESVRQYSLMDLLVEKFNEKTYNKKTYKAYCNPKNLYMTLEKISDTEEKLGKKSWAYYINAHLTNDNSLEIKLCCSNEYITKSNKDNTIKKLCEYSKNKQRIKDCMESYLNNHKNRFVCLKSLNKIEYFDFSKDKINEAVKSIKELAKDFDDLLKIYPSQKGIK